MSRNIAPILVCLQVICFYLTSRVMETTNPFKQISCSVHSAKNLTRTKLKCYCEFLQDRWTVNHRWREFDESSSNFGHVSQHQFHVCVVLWFHMSSTSQHFGQHGARKAGDHWENWWWDQKTVCVYQRLRLLGHTDRGREGALLRSLSTVPNVLKESSICFKQFQAEWS